MSKPVNISTYVKRINNESDESVWLKARIHYLEDEVFRLNDECIKLNAKIVALEIIVEDISNAPMIVPKTTTGVVFG